MVSAARPRLPNAHHFAVSQTSLRKYHAGRASTWGLSQREAFQELSELSILLWGCGHGEMNRTPAVMIKNHEDE